MNRPIYWMTLIAFCTATRLVQGEPAQTTPTASERLSAAQYMVQNVATSAVARAEARAYLEQVAFAEPADKALVSRAAESLRPIYSAAKQSDKLETLIRRQLKVNETPLDVGLNLELASALVAQRKNEEARDLLEGLLKDLRGKISPANRIRTIRALTTIYTDQLVTPANGLAMIDREIGQTAATAVDDLVSLTALKAQLCFVNLDDAETARKCYEQIITLTLTSTNTNSQAEAYEGLARANLRLQKPDDAAGALLRYMNSPARRTIPEISARILEINPSKPVLTNLVQILRIQVASSVNASDKTAEPLQIALIRTLQRVGEPDAALQEAKIFFQVCSTQSLTRAIDETALAFKVKDGHLGRANAFLRNQKYGPEGEDGKSGTEDDMTDVLRAIPAINDPARAKLYSGFLVTVPEDWTGFQKRAQIQLYMGRPDEAFASLRRSFELCPISQGELQRSADNLTGFILRNTGSRALAESMIGYLMCGQAGKDGVMGSADDMTDPAAAILSQLAPATTKTAQQNSGAAPAASKPAAPSGT